MGYIFSVVANSWNKNCQVARSCDSLFASLRICLARLPIRDAVAEFGQLLWCHRAHRCTALAGTCDHYFVVVHIG